MNGRTRKTASGISIEKRINAGLTLFFEVKDEAYDMAKELRSYIFPCFEDFKEGHRNEFRHTGWGVPK